MFWSSQRIKAEQKWATTKTLPEGHPFDNHRIGHGPYEQPLISEFNEERAKHGAYELSLGRKYLITPNDSTSSFSLPNRDALRIPPGQFALLYTKESVSIPRNVIAFISLKGSVKFKGLINISGFQVDPGFPGHLKFSVYNASSEDVHLNFGAPCFLIWFADLDKENEPYTGDHKDQDGFTTEDRDRMSESRHSTENIHKRLIEIEKTIASIQAVGLIVIVPLLIDFVVAVFEHSFSEKAEPLSNGSIILYTTLIAGVFFVLLNLLFGRLLYQLFGLLIRFVQWIWNKFNNGDK